MSRQQYLIQSMLNPCCHFPPPVGSRPPSGPKINLDEGSIRETFPCQTWIQVTEKNDDIMVHLRRFRNGCPMTSHGVVFDFDGWQLLMALIPELDIHVDEAYSFGVQMEPVLLDLERSVEIKTSGKQFVEIMLRRCIVRKSELVCNETIVISYEQWKRLVLQSETIDQLIVEYQAYVLARAKARD